MLYEIETLLGEKVVSGKSLGGGCIANVTVIEMQDGLKYFLKSYGDNNSIHEKEANGLKELLKSKSVKIPSIIAVSKNFLLLEFIYMGKKKNNFSQEFGSQMAQLHKTTSSQFGFYEDNFIGSNIQKNIPLKEIWTEFYWENRLLFQLKLAEQNGFATPQFVNDFIKLESRVEVILDGIEEAPSLLHGDLWSGNYMVDDIGNPVLIDPAVYYGHRETDIAMTKMFGGFDADFYSAYNEEFPLLEDWEYRIDFYNLYHVLNHLNLFGRSYFSQANSIVQKYIR